jgi:hypothetical protein
MYRHQLLRSLLLSAGALLIAACAAQPASPTLLEKKFQRTAKHYLKLQHEGQTVYCEKGPTRSLRGPCVTESQLRMQVENFERSRNTVQPPVMPGAGRGGIGG